MPSSGKTRMDFHPELPDLLVPSRKEGYYLKKTPCCYVLRDTENNDVLLLNDTGVLIWELCTREYNTGELVAMLREVFPEQPERISRDVGRVLDTLREYDVIEFIER